MASKVPITKQIAWWSLVPHILIIVLFVYVFDKLDLEDTNEPIYAALTYFALAYLPRVLIASDHRKGMKLVKQEKFDEAIPHFQRSVDFFTRHAWIDKWRFLVLLSSSKMCYREMALCNIAFCLTQTGKGSEAKKMYEDILKEYPQNIIATTALRMVTSMQ
jgi:tetratricopeptide (TPR) repeat protein